MCLVNGDGDGDGAGDDGGDGDGVGRPTRSHFYVTVLSGCIPAIFGPCHPRLGRW